MLTFKLHTLSIFLHNKSQKHATKLVLQDPDIFPSNFTTLSEQLIPLVHH